MDKEYSWNDIIINPTSAGIEACIGKECYFSNNPTHCLNNANKKDNYYCDILEEIRIGRREPFIFKRQKHAASCIILKKEEPKSKYIPFESAKDLVESYQRSKEGLNRDTFEDNLASRFEGQGCRSYTLRVTKEGLTEVELKLKGLMGIESTFTAPRSIFREHIL